VTLKPVSPRLGILWHVSAALGIVAETESHKTRIAFSASLCGSQSPKDSMYATSESTSLQPILPNIFDVAVVEIDDDIVEDAVDVAVVVITTVPVSADILAEVTCVVTPPLTMPITAEPLLISLAMLAAMACCAASSKLGVESDEGKWTTMLPDVRMSSYTGGKLA
jgi:hypothetical protein